jgi:hypothetical protein
MPVNASFRTRMRMEKAVRLEVQGVPDPEIAQAIGLTYAALASMKMQPEYKQLRVQIARGVLAQIDEEIGFDLKEMRNRLRSHVPLALQAIVDAVSQKHDGKLRLQAAEALLDRDGSLPKVSRNVTLPDDPCIASSKDDEISAELVNAVAAAIPPSNTRVN